MQDPRHGGQAGTDQEAEENKADLQGGEDSNREFETFSIAPLGVVRLSYWLLRFESLKLSPWLRSAL